MTEAGADHSHSATLRLVWPQWQGGGRDAIGNWLPEPPLEVARRGYAIGARVLQAVLPPHDGPTEIVPVDLSDAGQETEDGIESRAALVRSLQAAQDVLAKHQFDRVLTLGGECSVSVAPFAALAERYGEDLAVVWIDAHPDVSTPQDEYNGYHAMAVSVLTGHGDQRIVDALPATVDPSRVALTGLHDRAGVYPKAEALGLSTFGPDDLRESTQPLLDWIDGTGCSRVAIHLDVDVVDSDEVTLGMSAVPGGLTTAQVRRVVDDVRRSTDVVGLTIAEFVPRDVIAIRGLVEGMPLLGR